MNERQPRRSAAVGAWSILLLALCSCEPGGTPPPKAPSERPLFVLAVGSAAPTFTHDNGATGEFYTPEIMGSGSALIDYDNDGDLDLYLLQGAPLTAAGRKRAAAKDEPLRNRLYRNDLEPASPPQLRWSDVTTKSGLGDSGYGMGCAVADYDGDGWRDLYVTNYGPNVLFRNRGDGTFERTSQASADGFHASASFFDADADGDLDLFVTTYLEFSPGTTRECRRLGGQDDYCGPLSYEPRPDVLYRNDGDGTFTEISAAAGITSKAAYGLGVVTLDFDGDGRRDVFVANDATPNHLWRNRGDGTFEESALLAGVAVNHNGENEAGMGIALSDYDDDGAPDLLLTHERGETNTLYRATGPREFVDQTLRVGLGRPSLPYAGFGAGWLDADHDGDLDLFVTNGAVRALPQQIGEPHPYRQPDQLYTLQDGRFVDASARGGLTGLRPEAGRGAAFGDLDLDGDVDVVVTNNHGPLRVLLGEPPSEHSWAQLLVEDSPPNRDAYGAHVRVELEGGGTRHFRVGTDGSYLSASSAVITVGLGKTGRIARVVVDWPDGTSEAFPAVASQRRTPLRRGHGEAH